MDAGREGLWLPETAVNLETLDIMAQHGIGFAILSPSQAQRVRPIDGDEWQDVSGGRIDHTMAYRVPLPSGRFMPLFFYDGSISQGVAFEGLLDNGEAFANRLGPRSPTTGRILASSTSQRMAKAMGIIISAVTWPSLVRSMILSPTGLRG